MSIWGDPVMLGHANYGFSLLDRSDAPFITLEEFWNTYTDHDETWGKFDVHGTGATKNNEDEYLHLSKGTWLTADVQGPGGLTIYGMLKTSERPFDYEPLYMVYVKREDGLYAPERESTALIDLFRYDSGTRTDVQVTDFRPSYYSGITALFDTYPYVWHIYALVFDVSGNNIKLFVDGVKKGERTPAYVDRMVCKTLAIASNVSGSGGFAEIAIKYCSVVQKADSDALVIANSENIMSYFGLDE